MSETITATFIDFNPGTEQHEIAIAHDAQAQLGAGGTDLGALFIPLDPPGAPVSVAVHVTDFNAGATEHTTWAGVPAALGIDLYAAPGEALPAELYTRPGKPTAQLVLPATLNGSDGLLSIPVTVGGQAPQP